MYIVCNSELLKCCQQIPKHQSIYTTLTYMSDLSFLCKLRKTLVQELSLFLQCFVPVNQPHFKLLDAVNICEQHIECILNLLRRCGSVDVDY